MLVTIIVDRAMNGSKIFGRVLSSGIGHLKTLKYEPKVFIIFSSFFTSILKHDDSCQLIGFSKFEHFLSWRIGQIVSGRKIVGRMVVIASSSATATSWFLLSCRLRVVDDGDVVAARPRPVAAVLWFFVRLGDHLLRQVKEKLLDAAIQFGRSVVVFGADRTSVSETKN